MTVIDSSYVAASFLTERHTSFVRASRIWTSRLIAPALLPFEFANVLWKNVRRGVLTEDQARQRLRDFYDLGLELEAVPGPEHLETVLQQAHTCGLTIYDAAYLELALRARAELATLDADLAAAARKAGVAVHHP